MTKKKLTIDEMAALAKVSTATISRVMNPETRNQVAPKTREKIEALIQKHGYTPNRAAQHLSASRYKAIGVLLPHHHGMLHSEYYTHILAGVSDALLDEDYQFKMVLLKPEHKPWDHYDFKNGEGVDGLIVTYWRSFFEKPSVFKKLGLPCVILNNVEDNIRARFVAGDHYDGARKAAEHLADHGHRNFAVMSGHNGAPDVAEKLNGFLDALKKRGIAKENIHIYDVRFEEKKAYQLTCELIEKKDPATAYFCMNDTQALGVLQAMRKKGRVCPKHYSVVGYDNDRKSEHSRPALTTVEVPVYEMARQAAIDLIRQLKAPKQKGWITAQRFPVNFICRSSVAKIQDYPSSRNAG